MLKINIIQKFRLRAVSMAFGFKRHCGLSPKIYDLENITWKLLGFCGDLKNGTTEKTSFGNSRVFLKFLKEIVIIGMHL